MSRISQILRGKSLTPLTELEGAIKYAVDNSGSQTIYTATIDGSTGDIDAIYDETGVALTFETAKTAVEAGKYPTLIGSAQADGLTLMMALPLVNASWLVSEGEITEGEIAWSIAVADESDKGSIITVVITADDTVATREVNIT